MARLRQDREMILFRLGGDYLQAAAIILAIRTAWRDVVVDDPQVASRDLDREVEFALSMANA